MKSTRYIKVKVDIEHPEDVSPDDVISECDYEITSQTDGCKITETEITEVY